MFNLSLTEDQIKTIMESDPNMGLAFFRDSNGNETISEGDNFHTRLKFYLSKLGSTKGELLTYFRNAYPTLLSSESGLNHILNGIRTPKLSVVMAMAEFLEVAPAALLPGVPGKFIVKEDNHVELLSTPVLFSAEQEETEEVEETLVNEVIEDKDDELFENYEEEVSDDENITRYEDVPLETENEVSIEEEVDTQEPEPVLFIDEAEDADLENLPVPILVSENEEQEEEEIQQEEEEDSDDIKEEELEEIDDLLNSIF